MQILILGSDTATGKTPSYGSAEDSTGYGHSDVMMLMDISADNKRVSVMSFPRDLLVDSQVQGPDEQRGVPGPSGVMINEAMRRPGSAALWTRSTSSRPWKSTTS